MGVVRKDMQTAGVTEEDAWHWVRWRQVICCSEPLMEQPKEEEKEKKKKLLS